VIASRNALKPKRESLDASTAVLDKPSRTPNMEATKHVDDIRENASHALSRAFSLAVRSFSLAITLSVARKRSSIPNCVPQSLIL
jgi:hypothetical protein